MAGLQFISAATISNWISFPFDLLTTFFTIAYLEFELGFLKSRAMLNKMCLVLALINSPYLE